MDATMHASVFHLQSSHYDKCRPPTFFDNDELNKLNLTRERTRHDDTESTLESLSTDHLESFKGVRPQRLKSVLDCEKERTSENVFAGKLDDEIDDNSSVNSSFSNRAKRNLLSNIPVPPPSPYRRQDSPLPKSVLDGQWDVIPPTPDIASSDILQRTTLNSKYFPSSQIPNQNFAYRPNGHTPPLFLQELAHLSSLACAVALSVLRNDVEDSESPLDIYIPGSPWPVSDPDKLPRNIRNEFQHTYHILTIIRHWLGLDRLPGWRSYYNAARPLLIIGGVSNGEIKQLQKARGSHAKVTLAMSWLKEFIIREHLNGSLGEVHSAIISRLVQFISDGMLHYHLARKIMYIPFPFPHAQLSAFYSGIMVFAVPFLMDQYTSVLWMGSLLSFLTVTCLVGLHEVARELENPFRNVPNEIPLCTLQAMYNEALITMFSGFNPDSFWDAELYQGALEAMAMGKVYHQKKQAAEEEDMAWSTNDNDGILEMNTLDEMDTLDMSARSKKKKKKKKTLVVDTVLEPSSSTTEVAEAVVASPPKIRTKSVTFAKEIEINSPVSSDVSVKDLRDILAKQTAQLEELSQLLDEEEGDVMTSQED